MVGGVSGRVHAFEGKAATLYDLAILDADVGHEVEIAAGFDLGFEIVAGPTMRAEGIGLGTAPLFERLGSRGVIAMAMRDEDVRDALAGECALQGFNVLGQVGPG